MQHPARQARRAGGATRGHGQTGRPSIQRASVFLLRSADTSVVDVPQHAQPITAHLLVNYDLPTSREHHQRRIASIIGPSPATSGGHAQRAMIHFVVAGQMAAFRALEVFSGSSIREMPVHAADILA